MSTPVDPSTPAPIVGTRGVKTSEFIVAVVTIALLVAGTVLHRDLRGDVPLVAEAGVALSSAAYALSRAITKVGVVRALSTASVRTSLVTALGAVETGAAAVGVKLPVLTIGGGGSGYTVKMAAPAAAGEPAPVEPAPMAAAIPPPTIPSPPPPLSTDEQATLAGLLARQSPPTAPPPAAVEPVVASV